MRARAGSASGWKDCGSGLHKLKDNAFSQTISQYFSRRRADKEPAVWGNMVPGKDPCGNPEVVEPSISAGADIDLADFRPRSLRYGYGGVH